MAGRGEPFDGNRVSAQPVFGRYMDLGDPADYRSEEGASYEFTGIDLNLSPNWEFNIGVGVGVTQGTDHLLVKMILGSRFKL